MIVVEAPEGLIVIDTSDSQTAVEPIIEYIRANISSAPFKAIIYTHFHNDHIGGAQVRNILRYSKFVQCSKYLGMVKSWILFHRSTSDLILSGDYSEMTHFVHFSHTWW